MSLLGRLSIVCLLVAFPAAASAVPCRSGNFESWLETFKREVAAQEVSQSTIESALGGVSYDPIVISRDRSQGVFRRSFEQFAYRMVSRQRLDKGAKLLRRHATLLRGI